MRLAVFASGGGSNFQSIVDAAESGALKARVVLCVSNNPSAGVLDRATKSKIPVLVLKPAQPPGRELPMRKPKRDVNDFLPMNAVEFTVLLVLADGASHGYAIVKQIEEHTDGQISLLPGNLYAILRRLMAAGLIAHAPATSSNGADKRRRNYRITAFGRKVAAAEATRMKRMVEAAATRDLVEDAAR